MSKVFVLNNNKEPLDPVHPGQARLLLTAGKAAVYRSTPFTIILKENVPDAALVSLRLKIDPGARTTGLALVDDASGEVVWAAELAHRGEMIKKALDKRRGVRRRRRARAVRYRAPKWHNRRRRKGWLPPSLLSRVANILTWVGRLCHLCHVGTLSQKLVRFDLQKLENPEIAGMLYQQGTLAGYEVREYLLEKWQRTCAYCGAQHVPLQIEHIQSRSHGGTDRLCNLTLACEDCNQKKGTQDIRLFLAHDEPRLVRILAQAKASLKDAAAVNATRWELKRQLEATGLSLELGSGGRTKFNRVSRNLPKTHWLDAACIGASTPKQLHALQIVALQIRAVGRGHRRMCNVNEIGFPISHRKRRRRYFGFQTGDRVRAVVPAGFKSAGTHVGRVAIKAAGTFTIGTAHGKVTDVPHRFCRHVARSDGYSYHYGFGISLFPVDSKKTPVSSPSSAVEFSLAGIYMEEHICLRPKSQPYS